MPRSTSTRCLVEQAVQPGLFGRLLDPSGSGEDELEVSDFPEMYCFHWEQVNDKVARGFRQNMKTALSKLQVVSESGCGFTLEICCRNGKHPGVGTPDFYEPNEPNLEGIEFLWVTFKDLIS